MKILIVRLAAMGDLVFASSLLTRIRAERPGAHVTWAVSEPLADLVRLFDVDRVVGIPGALLGDNRPARARALVRAWALLRQAGPFDRVIIAHEDQRYRLLAWPLGAPSVRMLTPNVPRHANPIPGRYAGDEYARLLDDDDLSRGPIAGHYEASDLRPVVAPPDDAERRPYVVLVPGGGVNARRSSPLRRWPAERYVEVAKRLRAEGLRVVLVGDKNDRWAQPLFAGVDVEDRMGHTTIPETLSLLRGSRVVISHDTGPLHLARLVRTPVVAMFGPQLPSKHVPASAADAVVLWGGAHLACRPCYDPHEPALCTNNLCMQDLSVDRVMAAASDLLTSGRAAGM
jgi:heptosyltransferase-2